MLKHIIVVLFPFMLMVTWSNKVYGQQKAIPIVWSKHLGGDFSFTTKWDYALGVELKENGKAGCADGGFCPERCYSMLDSNGIVFPDSTTAFYQLLDTSHFYYTLECTGQCSEWAGSNYITAQRMPTDTVFAFTACNVATHCSMQLSIGKKHLLANVILNSIVQGNDAKYALYSGTFTLDKKWWKKGILKGVFNLSFKNGDEVLQWSGKICTPILQK